MVTKELEVNMSVSRSKHLLVPVIVEIQPVML